LCYTDPPQTVPCLIVEV